MNQTKYNTIAIQLLRNADTEKKEKVKAAEEYFNGYKQACGDFARALQQEDNKELGYTE